MFYTYMLRCEDNSIYTGITTNVERRMSEHFSKNEKCAKYTKRHPAKKLECVWQSETRKDASKLEYHIKTLKKEAKEKLINKDAELNDLLGDKIDVNKYFSINV